MTQPHPDTEPFTVARAPPVAPKPGSDEAVAAGCLCAVFDNCFGQGAMGTAGPDALFFITVGCPVHAPASEATDQPPATVTVGVIPNV